ncbi:helix-turn-helix transcriptional regulator [Clostridium sp. OS1-26]|uniref:helix-turn-helix domain-containing protein n=1 Tax=Clostridium sp. OS1-26 TaxID=3070681 RepID=UPI0027E0AC94|nr:helix-turn-helix transcriptional regulator [Clostridium sp. OS1-26]WML33139.1 helix-turn-helix transcriptional regulator [Clostridium sp. OS1-26]
MIQLFREKYGLTPVKYLNQLRIKKSLDLLSNTSINITDIALCSGFESLSTFYDFFKKQIGMTPKEYRKK